MARLLTFDARIYVLATILKYWAKVHDCAGKNRISNYALVWMLLFYLQQLPVPILPPIIEFQRRILPLFVNGYNFAFDEYYPNQTRNQSRCSELLMGFFKFYKSFDFDTSVISPLYGKVFKKADILSRQLPEFHRYHDMIQYNPNITPMQFNKCICIQDPFEITHSIPGAIATKEFQKIIAKFEYAAEIIGSELQADGESTKLLMSIFDAAKFTEHFRRKNQKVPIEPRTLLQSCVTKSTSSTNHKIILHVKPNDYHLSIIRDILTKKNSDPNAKIDNQTIHRHWTELMVEGIHVILQDIFMVTMKDTSNKSTNGTNTPSTSATPDTSEDTANSDDSKNNPVDLFSKEYSLSGYRDVFLARKQAKKLTVNSLNYERLESQERFKKNALQIQLTATVNITTDKDNFELITMEFNDLIKTKKNNSFRNFLTNFEQNLNRLLRVYLVHKCGTAA